MTALGASVVFFVRSQESVSLRRLMLGFAAGVMLAASMWSLLIPAIEQAEAFPIPNWLPAAVGSLLGILFLIGMDALFPILTRQAAAPGGLRGSGRRSILFALAVTLHNIPEGMAVGLSIALAASGDGSELPAAMALAISVGIQNFPEGTAIALPLRRSGMGRVPAFLIGAASGVVEPIFGLLAVLVAGQMAPLMPWLLSFAAGAMLYVVVEELIPEANLRHNHQTHSGTLGVMAGFLLIMILDLALQ